MKLNSILVLAVLVGQTFLGGIQANGDGVDRIRGVPAPTLPGDFAAPDNLPVGYDLQTGRETVLPAPEIQGDLLRNQVAGSRGALPLFTPEVLDTPLSFSDLTLQANPRSYPWRTTVWLELKWAGDANTYFCTGTLIDPYWLVTAGRCIHDTNKGGWVTSLRAIPATTLGDQPMGDAYGDQLWSWTGWTQNQDTDWDMGYVKLFRPVGALAGWLGYGWTSDSNFYYNNGFESCGYPTEQPAGSNQQYEHGRMYCWNGSFDLVQTDVLWHNKVWHNFSVFGAPDGMQGSSVHYSTAESPYRVHGVYSRAWCAEGCFT